MVTMDNNFIKDNRVFPEEMSTSKKTTKKATQTEHPAHVMWWILALLALLTLVFFIGLWAGKRTARVIDDQNNQLQQEQVQQAIEQQVLSNDVYVSSEARTERLRNFFSE